MVAGHRHWAWPTFVPQANAITVAAMTDTTRVLLKVLSDILPPITTHSRNVVQLT